MLGEFCLLAFLQSSIFLAWNPIANSALKAFGPQWTPSTLAWQINLATISSPFVQYPVWYFLKKFGLSRTIRWLAVLPLVISSLLSSLPVLISVQNEVYQWLTYGSYLFTGVTGVVFFSCVTRFSANWFGPRQTATSTGMACTFANLGGILPSIVGPIWVTDPYKNPEVPVQEIQQEIYNYMLLYLVLSLILFGIFWMHFPENQNFEQPDLNESVRTDIIQILKSGNVILVILVASLGSIPHIWGSTLLTVTLSRLEIYQNFVGAITSISLISSTIFTFTLTRCADLYFGQSLKNLIMGLMPVHALTMIVLAVCILIGTPQANYQCKYIFFEIFMLQKYIRDSIPELHQQHYPTIDQWDNHSFLGSFPSRF